MNLGIIGYGSFGKFMHEYLKKYISDISIYDKFQEIDSLSQVCNSEIVILAMPMGALQETLHNIKDILKPGTLVLDICSLKVFSAKLMLEILPDTIEIIGAHPLFGPNSAKQGIGGLNIALCNIRTTKFDKVKNFCSQTLNLNTHEVTPEEHDFQMAISQALTHFIGHIAQKIDLDRVELGTKTFDNLMDVIEIIEGNSEELFRDMQILNPYAREVREIFINGGIDVHKELNALERKVKETPLIREKVFTL